MDARIQVVAIVVAAGLLLGILELVRQRRLLERYAIVWLLAAIILLALAVWRDLLTDLATLIGIAYPPNALFFIAFGAILLLLLHFSIAVSRLHDQSKVLAQRVALLEEQMRHVEPESETAARDTIAVPRAVEPHAPSASR